VHRNIRIPKDLNDAIQEEADKHHAGVFTSAFRDLLYRAAELWKQEAEVRERIRRRTLEDANRPIDKGP
jgi:hypothetical protein